MNRERLEHLITVLEKVPAGRFDLNHWVKNGCGMTACAGGWAALDPEFIAQGLKLRRRGAVDFPEFNNKDGFGGLASFFEVTYCKSYDLFSRHGYPVSRHHDPAAVIARVRELLASGT